MNETLNILFNPLIGYSFDIEYNDINLNRFNITKKLTPILKEFNKIEKDNSFDNGVEKYNEIKNNVLDKIKLKIKSELDDEKDLLNVYTSKTKKLIEKLKEEFKEELKEKKMSKEDIINKIKQTIETPLEGEMAKHNKIKTITIKIHKTETIDCLFYIKYKQIEGYNKQINKLIESISNEL